jgi:uncharacterized protein
MTLTFRQLSERFMVCRLSPDAPLPAWVPSGPLVSITRTQDEVSIVCPEQRPLPDVKCEAGWVALKLEGPFPFSQTGILASFLQPLAEGRIPIFAISTFDTDYVLIKHENLEAALHALSNAGHQLAR